ncbi:MAG: hypothetical protein WC821_02825 [archaeon]|jgi:hypothetical protein
MNDKTISKICLAITLIGMLILIVMYKPEFEESTINHLLNNEESKGIIFARIETVIQRYPVTLFVATDGNKALFFSPSALKIEKNDFVIIYAEHQIGQYGEESDPISTTLFAHKVVKE